MLQDNTLDPKHPIMFDPSSPEPLYHSTVSKLEGYHGTHPIQFQNVAYLRKAQTFLEVPSTGYRNRLK